MRRCRSRSGEGSPESGDKMPKHASSKWRQPFWFVVFVSFSLSFLLLFYLYQSSSLVKHNAVTLFSDQAAYGFSHSVVDYGTIINDHLDNERHDPDDADEERPEPDEKVTDDDVEIDRDDDAVEVTEEPEKPETDEGDDDGNDQDSVLDTEDEEKEEESNADDDHAEESEKHKLDDKRAVGDASPDKGSNTTEVEKLKINYNTTSNGTAAGQGSVSDGGKGFGGEKLQAEKPADRSIEGRKHLNVHNDRAQDTDHGSSVSNQVSNHTATKLEEQGNSADRSIEGRKHLNGRVQELDHGDSVSNQVSNHTATKLEEQGNAVDRSIEGRKHLNVHNGRVQELDHGNLVSNQVSNHTATKLEDQDNSADRSIEGRKHLNVHNDRAQDSDHGSSVSNQVSNHTAIKLEEQANSADRSIEGRKHLNVHNGRVPDLDHGDAVSNQALNHTATKVEEQGYSADKSIEGRKHLNVHNGRTQDLDHGNSGSNQIFNHTTTKLEEHGNSADRTIEGRKHLNLHNGRAQELDHGNSVSNQVFNHTAIKPEEQGNSVDRAIEGRKHLNVHNDRTQYLDHGSSVSNQISNDTSTKLEDQGNSGNGYQNETSHGGLGVRENAEEKNKSDSGQRVAEKLPYKMLNSDPTKGSVREATNRGHADEAQKKEGSTWVADTETPKVSDNLNTSNVDPCRGRYIYIHELPSRFNEDMIMNCKSLSKWFNMCEYITNYGLGPQLNNTLPEFSGGGWFSTNQFALELIFHHRMIQYKCLTKDSSKASAIYVPYYSGLDVSRYLWSDRSLKDSAALDLAAWLRDQDQWKRMWGRDHFFVAGRITWDFRREGDNLTNWGNKLMYLPESKNMTILTIESSPWHMNDFAVPYPSYFHPKTDEEVRLWQHKVRKMKRKYLFSFAGGTRPNLRHDIRGAIFNQCEAAKHKCSLLECVEGNNTCYEPVNLMNLFESSVFCLQPSGDSLTRRSTFDSILAGCIPVFFHPGSAYVQYLWHFPRDFWKYSVYIPAKDVKEKGVSIERVLSEIPMEKVVAMREELIRLIPKITYVYPRFGVKTGEDAFDIAVNGVLERVETVRKEMEEGKNSSFGFEEEHSWKWFRQGGLGKHDWDDLFDRSGEMKFIPTKK